MRSKNFLKLSVNFLERVFGEDQMDVRAKFSHQLLTKIVSLYLGQFDSVSEIQKTHFYKKFDVGGYIDSFPEEFYFSSSDHVYIGNLVSFNTTLVVDDLVVRYLSQLHNSNKMGSNSTEMRGETLECLFYILKHRTFRRPTLRLIFDNLVYFDTGDNFYRFGILDFVIRYYKESDASVALGGHLSGSAESSTSMPTLSNELQPLHIQHAYKSGIYCDTGDLCSDNTMVLSNLIWEEMRKYLLDSDVVLQELDTVKFAEKSSESLFLNRGVLIKEFSCSDIEKMCIIELLGTIVDCTGSFFCNRITQNQELLERVKELPGIVGLLDKMIANFERIGQLSETFLKILEKKNTDRSQELISVLAFPQCTQNR